jgi:hypothetical protein
MRSLILTVTGRIGKSHEKRSGNGMGCVGMFCTDRDRGGRNYINHRRTVAARKEGKNV